MTIEEKVFETLSVPGVTALCPAARIKPDGVYQALARPYIKHQAINVDPTKTHAGSATLTYWGYQISIFADSAAQLAALRTAVMTALEASSYPKFFVTGLATVAGMDSTDTTVLGQALLVDAWYE